MKKRVDVVEAAHQGIETEMIGEEVETETLAEGNDRGTRKNPETEHDLGLETGTEKGTLPERE